MKDVSFMDSLLEENGIDHSFDAFTPTLLFHVDKRIFNPGEIILPNGKTYEESLTNEKKELEELLNSVSHLTVRRSNHVFLFDEFKNALCYAGKVSGCIYQVRIDPQDMCLKADMNKLDNILDVFRFTEDDEIRKAASIEYWKSGTHTFSPCFEYLVKKCTVEKCISTADENVTFHKQLLLNYHPIEQCKWYLDKINSIYNDE